MMETTKVLITVKTSQVHHFVSKNPFIIIGTFHPKKEPQGRLF